MGRAKSFRKRFRNFFCCFQENVENVDVIPPTPRPHTSSENINLAHEKEGVESPKIRVGYKIEKTPGKGSVVFVYQANDNEGSIFDRHGDDAVTGCAIGGQGIKYLDKGGDGGKATNMWSYSKLQPFYTYQRDVNSVNAWSRHLSGDNARPMYANVNLTKGIVPSLNDPSKMSAYRNVMMSWSEQQINTRPKCARGRKSDHVATQEGRPDDKENDNDYVNPYCLLIV